MNVTSVKWGGDKLKTAKKAIANAIKIQSMHGNWDYSPYMHGFLNALVFANAVLNDMSPIYFDAPNEWGMHKDVRRLPKSSPTWYVDRIILS